MGKNMTEVLVKSAKKQIRESFRLLKENAFPKEQRDALDYKTLCLIEDEFRKEEEACVTAIESGYKNFEADMESWVKKMNDSLSRFTKIAINTMGSFSMDLKRHMFTYDMVLPSIPPPQIDRFMREREVAHVKILERHDKKKEVIHRVWDKVRNKIRAEESMAEEKFKNTINELITVEMPRRHKQVENLIQQNYLQRVGAIHGLN